MGGVGGGIETALAWCEERRWGEGRRRVASPQTGNCGGYREVIGLVGIEEGEQRFLIRQGHFIQVQPDEHPL
jgi:hypothetical protein